ncbi:hypothetical protein V8D89_007181 [Ganoderma adspersum]
MGHRLVRLPVSQRIEMSARASSLPPRQSMSSSVSPSSLHSLLMHYYVRKVGSSAYSALVQLYLRSSQLDDAFTCYRRFRDVSPTCHFGCDSLETPHHIFVQCPHFAVICDEASRAVIRDTSSLLDATETPLPTDVIIRIAHALFIDDPLIWPQTASHYHYGTVPSLPEVPAAFGGHLPSKRLLSRVAALWHSSSIRLSARIWGSYKRATYPFSPRSKAQLLVSRFLLAFSRSYWAGEVPTSA